MTRSAGPAGPPGWWPSLRGRVRWLVRQSLPLADALAGLVWPVTCAGCGRLDVALCPNCARSMAGPPVPGDEALGPVPVWGLSAYGGVAARLIVAWKQHGRRDLTRPLGRALSHAVSACLADARARPATEQGSMAWPATEQGSMAWPATEPGSVVWLVPMPARGAALRQRGADLPYDLAAVAARSMPGVRAVRVLRHARRVRDQVGLDGRERRRNLAGALTLRRGTAATGLAGRICIVVDDIVTTGASVSEAVRVLQAAHAQVVGVCCLSVTLKQRGVPIEPERTSLPSWKAPSGS